MVPSWAEQLLPQLLMEQFDTLPIQCRHIEHMHGRVWFRKNNFGQNDSCENLDNVSLIRLCIHIDDAFMGRSTPTTTFKLSNLILCRYNIDTLNICMNEFGLEKKNF